MIGEITQDNLYLLLPSKVCWLADMLTKEKGIGLIDAIKQIYSSETYRKLATEDTKLWHLGPADLYTELEAEKK